MALDLETLRTEMQTHLQESGIPVFYGYHGLLDPAAQVSWDTEGHPDFRDFLATAHKAGAALVVFNHESFSLDQIDDALDQLEESDFTREEKRNYETRLRQLQAYEGFTCSVQLSFSVENRLYVFELHTDWYQALAEIINELDVATEEEIDEEQGPIGGYFSNN
jgi:hypothetical protein